MEDLVYGLNWLKPPARRPPSNRMVEDEPPYKWVVTFKKPPLKIKEN